MVSISIFSLYVDIGFDSSHEYKYVTSIFLCVFHLIIITEYGCTTECKLVEGYSCTTTPVGINNVKKTCKPKCGDGILTKGFEECDDHNTDAGTFVFFMEHFLSYMYTCIYIGRERLFLI